jgi:hypothetical protein
MRSKKKIKEKRGFIKAPLMVLIKLIFKYRRSFKLRHAGLRMVSLPKLLDTL